MRPFVPAALALCLSTAAAIADDDADAPITYHVPGVTVVVQRHSEPIKLRKDPNITWLKRAFTYDCLAANCLVIATSQVQTGGQAYDVCVYADGKPMKPTCAISGNLGQMNNLQDKLIPQGVHSFQTQVKSDTSVKSTVCPCIVTYTIYDLGN
jgi:hypothetical protein